MDCKKSCLLFHTGLYTGLVLCLVSLMIKASLPGILGIIIMVSGILQAVRFYRCPHCHKALDFKGKKPNYCPGGRTSAGF